MNDITLKNIKKMDISINRGLIWIVTAQSLRFFQCFVCFFSACMTTVVINTNAIVSQKVFMKSVCKSQFPHKFVNSFFVLVIVKIHGFVGEMTSA